jgi:ParB family chromosome partitioning protein
MAKNSRIASKTADIDMSGFKKPERMFDGQTPPLEDVPTPRPEPRRAFTGVSSVIAGITGGHETAQELEEAKQELARFEGASPARPLDPTRIKRSRWANRIEAEFSTTEFKELKADIAKAGGNVQAIKVREVGPDRYEIVFGHRRHQACLELGLPVNAVIEKSLSDQALFEAMDRENRARKNLSAWEQGRMYNEALKGGLYPSLRRLAESVGVNLSAASRSIQLATLPKDVIAAFSSPLDLQVRWAKPLADALQRDPDAVVQRAKSLRKEAGKLSASEVFERLAGLVRSVSDELEVVVAGKKLAVVSTDSKGRAVVVFEAGVVSDERRSDLARLVQEFAEKVRGV